MALVHTLCIALHILFAAAWFGMGIGLLPLSRSRLAGGPPEGDKLVRGMNGSSVLFYVFAVANWVIGMDLGFEVQYNTWPYHTALTLGLVIVGVQWGIIRPAWNKLTAGGGEAAQKRLAMGVGIGHLAWFVLFVLMYLGRGVVGA